MPESDELLDKIREAHRRSCIESHAMGMILVEKGLVTVEEWNRYRAKASHKLDQYWAQLRDLKTAEDIT